jgi:cytochrome c-type biogenesis protein CcmF
VNGAFGHTGVLLGFAASVVGVVVLGVGLARGRPATLRHGRLYAPLVLLGGVVAVLAMEHALLTHDFSLTYVADNNSRSTPALYSVTGLWSALAGSILLWAVVLGGYASAMVVRFRRRGGDPLVGWATLVVYAVAAFFFGLMLGPADPFRHVAGAIPRDGLGPNSLLQDNPLVLIHPPMLYLGLVGFTLPFAFAVATLVTGRLDEDWQGETRRFVLVAWAFLTMGIILGAWWSYQVLGWGGFWSWDPVENAALMPWLVGTAYLHSVMVEQRRGLLRIWNLTLVVATFALTILGTFLTRSGVIQSVHSFSESTIGPLLLAFFGVVLVTGLGLIAWRGDRLRSPGGIDAAVSREGAFLLNNLLFVAFAFVVLLGTVFPLLYQALGGDALTVGAPYFNRFFVPVGFGLLFLMAVAPALPWRKASLEVVRARLVVPAAVGVAVVVACVLAGVRGVEPLVAFGLGAFAGASALRSLGLSVRGAWQGARRAGSGPWRAALSGWRGLVGRANGGMVVHVGVVVVAVGLASATSFVHRSELRLRPGQSAVFAGHRVTFVGHRTVTEPSHASLDAELRVDRATFTPALSEFNGSSQAVGTPAIDSSWRDDVYLTIDSVPGAGSTWTFGIVEQPLVMWLWIGAALVAAGSVLAAVPGRRRRPTDPVSAPVVAVPAAASGRGSAVPSEGDATTRSGPVLEGVSTGGGEHEGGAP